jgi:hypothetical protein
MDVTIQLHLRCDQQSEVSPDELYLTVGIVHSNGVAHAKSVWEGSLCSTDDPLSRRERTLDVWHGHIEPGNVAALILNLVEQDMTGNRAGVEFAKQLATRAGGCIAQAKTLEALEALGCHDFGPIIKRATSAFGCLKGDDLMGSFMVALARPEEGGLRGKVYPIAETDFVESGDLVLYGGGSIYIADPIINGRPILHRPAKVAP